MSYLAINVVIPGGEVAELLSHFSSYAGLVLDLKGSSGELLFGVSVGETETSGFGLG